MKDLIVTINSATRKVKLNKDFIGLCAENLQGNIIVDFQDEFVDGVGFLEVNINGNKFVVSMDRNTDNKIYSTPIKSNLLKNACNIICQVKITQLAVGTEVPVFRSEQFVLPCKESVCAETELPEDPQSWQELIESRVAEVQENEHTHNNKSILDETTASYTTEEKEKLNGIGENVETLTTDVETLTTDVKNLKTGVETLTTNVDDLQTEVTTLSETVENMGNAGTGKTLIEDIYATITINDYTYTNDVEDPYLPFTNTKCYFDDTQSDLTELDRIPNGTCGRCLVMSGDWVPFFKIGGSIYIYCSDKAICLKPNSAVDGIVKFICCISYNEANEPTSITIVSIEY